MRTARSRYTAILICSYWLRIKLSMREGWCRPQGSEGCQRVQKAERFQVPSSFKGRPFLSIEIEDAVEAREDETTWTSGKDCTYEAHLRHVSLRKGKDLRWGCLEDSHGAWKMPCRSSSPTDTWRFLRINNSKSVTTGIGRWRDFTSIFWLLFKPIMVSVIIW